MSLLVLAQRDVGSVLTWTQPLRGELERCPSLGLRSDLFAQQRPEDSCGGHGQASPQPVLRWRSGPPGRARACPGQPGEMTLHRRRAGPCLRDGRGWAPHSLRSLPALQCQRTAFPHVHAPTRGFLPKVTMQQLIRSSGSVPGPYPTLS